VEILFKHGFVHVIHMVNMVVQLATRIAVYNTGTYQFYFESKGYLYRCHKHTPVTLCSWKDRFYRLRYAVFSETLI